MSPNRLASSREAMIGSDKLRSPQANYVQGRKFEREPKLVQVAAKTARPLVGAVPKCNGAAGGSPSLANMRHFLSSDLQVENFHQVNRAAMDPNQVLLIVNDDHIIGRRVPSKSAATYRSEQVTNGESIIICANRQQLPKPEEFTSQLVVGRRSRRMLAAHQFEGQQHMSSGVGTAATMYPLIVGPPPSEQYIRLPEVRPQASCASSVERKTPTTVQQQSKSRIQSHRQMPPVNSSRTADNSPQFSCCCPCCPTEEQSASSSPNVWPATGRRQRHTTSARQEAVTRRGRSCCRPTQRDPVTSAKSPECCRQARSLSRKRRQARTNQLQPCQATEGPVIYPANTNHLNETFVELTKVRDSPNVLGQSMGPKIPAKPNSASLLMASRAGLLPSACTQGPITDRARGKHVITDRLDSPAVSDDFNAVSQMYESLAAELKAKLGNAKIAPILLPPKDYDTISRRQGRLNGIETRRSTNPQLVGPTANRPISASQQQQQQPSKVAHSEDNKATSEDNCNRSPGPATVGPLSRSNSSSGMGSISTGARSASASPSDSSSSKSSGSNEQLSPMGHTSSVGSYSSRNSSKYNTSDASLAPGDQQYAANYSSSNPRGQGIHNHHPSRVSDGVLWNGRVEVPLKVNSERNGHTYLATKQIIYS